MDLEHAHDRLDETTREVVETITNLAATMKVLEEPDPHATNSALEDSAATLRAVGTFLETLAEAAGADHRLDPTTRETLLELEPPPSPETAAARAGSQTDDETTGNPFAEVTPLRRLSAPYSVLLNLERDLYANRIRRPFRLRKLKEIWGDLSRTGSSHPSEGLAARLGRLSEYLEAPKGGEAGVPWSADDREAVDELAARTEAILEWDDRECRRRERRDWVERVEDWVETAEEEPGSVAHMSEMLTRFLTDLPAEPRPDVRMLLERILELEQLPEELRERAERATRKLQE